MQYSATSLAYFNDTSHVGVLEGADVISACLGTVGVTDSLRLQVKVHQGMIVDACFKADGNVALLAAASYVCQHVIDKPVEQLQIMTVEALASALEIPKQRIAALMLVEDVCSNLLHSLGSFSEKSKA